MNRAPHREPLLAALARREQLRARIAELDRRAAPRVTTPTTLAAALAENERLERQLASLDGRGAVETADDVDDELAPVVHMDEAASDGEPPVDSGSTKRSQRRRTLLTLGVLAPIAAVVLVEQLAFAPPTGRGAAPPRDETTVRLTGVVVSRTGSVDAREGERCEILIVDSGEREAGRACTIDVRCPSLTQGFRAASCPIGEPKGPVRMHMNGLEIDALAGTATFISGSHGELIQGGATLRLDPSH